MSFSSDTKEDIIHHYSGNECCLVAELSAILHLNGSISIGSEISLVIHTENPALARRCFQIIKKLYNIIAEVTAKDNQHFNKGHLYMLTINGEKNSRTVLKSCGLMRDGEESVSLVTGIDTRLIRKKCCKRAFIKGTFLGAGSIANPEKNYHLEFIAPNKDFCMGFQKILASFGLNPKVVIRKDSYVIYIKDGEGIVDLLRLIGANNAILNLENVRILKQVRNDVNRAVNCETANLQKTLNASYRQAENIKYIENMMGFEKLSPQLREIAEMRIEYPDATLQELSDMLDVSIGKSGVNHRLRKLEEIAKRIRDREGER